EELCLGPQPLGFANLMERVRSLVCSGGSYHRDCSGYVSLLSQIFFLRSWSGIEEEGEMNLLCVLIQKKNLLCVLNEVSCSYGGLQGRRKLKI
ncbi:hypothetical protein U1Q18_049032, partial [Sarracenia purpurea var. burkii]